MEEKKSLKSKNFSIISHRASISSLYFVRIASTTAATIDGILFAIDCLTMGSMSAAERL